MERSMGAARIGELREAWDRAVERDRHADAVKALIELEKLDRDEPRWSQRLGEAYRRLGKAHEAEEAFVRATERYVEKGFLPRAVAMAKMVTSLNPARVDILAKLEPTPATGPKLTLPTKAAAGGAGAGGAGAAVGNAPAGAGKAAPAPTASAAKGKAAPGAPKGAAPLPSPGATAGATAGRANDAGAALGARRAGGLTPGSLRPVPLERAEDSHADEVRFNDLLGPSSLDILLDDCEDFVRAELPNDTADPAGKVGGPPGKLPDPREPSIDRLGAMATFRLFAGLSREALLDLSEASTLAEYVPGAMIMMRNEPAFALYAIIDGDLRVTVPGSPDIRLGEGDVVGEGCLLDEGERQADVRAETPVMALRIEKQKLDDVTERHAGIGDALFQLLARRLVTNVMQTSPLFAAFEPKMRLELAQMFEVRRADPGTVLAQEGKRSDGLYLLLAGNVTATGKTGETRIARGTTFGHASLIGATPSDVTVRAVTEAVLLRLPAAKFSSLAMLYPPVIAHLSDMADQPLRSSNRPQKK